MDEKGLPGLPKEFNMSRERLKAWSEKRKQSWESLFPMTVAKIEYGKSPLVSQGFSAQTGALVAVRPVRDEKTYLGFYIGDIASGFSLSYDKENHVLTVDRGAGNPAMYVPELKRIVFGYESWWSEIKSEDDLRQISDNDISNVWYVKALREMVSGRDEEE